VTGSDRGEHPGSDEASPFEPDGEGGIQYRSAEDEIDRLRARVNYLQGQLDIIYDAEYSRNNALKRRIEKLETAGDRVVHDVETLDEGIGAASNDVPGLLVALSASAQAWRSVRGER
jgi:hypothetical protein